MSDRTIIITIITVVLAGMAMFGALIWHKYGEGTRRCALIGAEYIDGGRGPSVCVKPDGSLWRLP